MSELTAQEQERCIDFAPANRCPDYDSECVDVVCPYRCWAGNEELPTAIGYCPMWSKTNDR